MFASRCVALSFCALSSIFAVENANPVEQSRQTLAKWVETRQLISKAEAGWQADKETLQQTVQLFERELASINEQTSKFSTNNTQVATERDEAESLKRSSEDALNAARAIASDMESKIRDLVPKLPLPLQETIKPLLNRIPADANTRMSAAERLQVVVGILSEFDKFNNAVTLFTEKRTNTKGEEIAVETVYVGLGAAYFTNDADDFAGLGLPAANGWDWQIKPEIGPTVREVIQIYRNERPARFVALPTEIR
ncbi:MAG TPA: DUF3450 family protein [Verrucomicrobiae bacterium]